jgi:hypothetical protein
VDGEGYDVSPDKHVYASLSASNGERMESIYNPYGLSSRECWEFELSLPAIFGPSIYVGFGLGYDIEFWLPPRADRVQLLDERGRCRYGPFRFLLWPRKRWEVGRVEGEKDFVRIDDTFSNFNCSLEDALVKWKNYVPLTDADWRILSEGKARRGQFVRSDFEDGTITRYNEVEHRATVGLVRALYKSSEQVGIHTTDFYSPKNRALALFRKHGVRIYPCPPDVEEPAYAAYFGGRIESAAYGAYLDTLYEYDLRRAYPWAMTLLPDFADGAWTHDANYRPDLPWSLYHIRWTFSPSWRFFPFAWRDSDGAVYYPPRGTGWVWAPEIKPRWVANRSVEVLEAFHFTPSENNTRPFAWQEEVYRRSLEYAKSGDDGAAYSLKVAQLSGYGALAQQTSAPRLVDGEWTRPRPRFHNPVYAGLITSLVRARMWNLMTEFNDIGAGTDDKGGIAFCTDAAKTTRPLIQLRIGDGPYGPEPVSDELGALKMTVFTEGHFLQSGVDETRDEDGKWSSRARGFASRSPPWDLIMDGWRRGLSKVTTVETRFIGHRRARAQTKYAARSWVDVPKDINLGPVGKRYLPTPLRVYTKADNPATRLYWTRAVDDILYTSESASNLPNFNRRLSWDEPTCEDVRDIGWETSDGSMLRAERSRPLPA